MSWVTISHLADVLETLILALLRRIKRRWERVKIVVIDFVTKCIILSLRKVYGWAKPLR